MDIITWLTEPAYVNRHVSPLYFIIITAIALAVLLYAIKTRNKRAVRVYIYAIAVWLVLELGLFFAGVRVYNIDSPYHIIFIIGVFEDPGWVCLAYIIAEKMMASLKHKNSTII